MPSRPEVDKLAGGFRGTHQLQVRHRRSRTARIRAKPRVRRRSFAHEPWLPCECPVLQWKHDVITKDIGQHLLAQRDPSVGERIRLTKTCKSSSSWQIGTTLSPIDRSGQHSSGQRPPHLSANSQTLDVPGNSATVHWQLSTHQAAYGPEADDIRPPPGSPEHLQQHAIGQAVRNIDGPKGLDAAFRGVGSSLEVVACFALEDVF